MKMQKDGRPTWNAYFLKIAEVVATRTTCPRASVGAVIVRDNRILSTGYNGSLPHEPHCLEDGCFMVNNHCKRTVHAETNAIKQAAKYGISVDGATLYLWSIRHHTNTPYDGRVGRGVSVCTKCKQVAQTAGIAKFIYDK